MLKVAALFGGVSAIIIHLVVGFQPTGSALSDALWVTVFGLALGAVTSRSSPTIWVLASLVGGIAASGAASVASSVGLLIAFALFTIPSWPAEQSRTMSVALGAIRYAVVPALMVQTVLRLHDFDRPGLSAVIAAGVIGVLVISSIRQSTTTTPRRVALACAGLSIATLAIAGIAASSLLDYRGLSTSLPLALENAQSDFADGEISSGSESLASVHDDVMAVNSSLSNRSFDILLHLPGFGPNVSAARESVTDLNSILDEALTVTRSLSDTDQLIDDGTLNTDQVHLVSSSVDDLFVEIRASHRFLAAPRSPWIVPQFGRQLDLAAEEAAPLVETLDTIPDVDQAVRWLLGNDEQRRYLILFGNPAEARELGGFAGGTSVVSVQDGEITVERTDRPDDLNTHPADPFVFDVAPPQRFLEHYPWLFSQNYTAMADFPTLAGALGDLYPEMGGSPIDGVIYLDTKVFSALLSITGPIQLSTGQTANADNVGRLLTVDQYDTFNEDDDYGLRDTREFFLDELMQTTFDRLMESPDDGFTQDLRPFKNTIEQDRLLFFPFDPAAQALTKAMGLNGGIAPLIGNDYLAVSHLNGGPNKLDAYMHRTVSYDANVDSVTGELTATATVVLRNDAPSGLPRYAADNSHGYPAATNRMTLVVHTPHELVEWSGGDEPELTRSYREFDRWRHERVVAVPRGQSRTVTITLAGAIEPFEQYILDVDHQPLLHDDDLNISVANESAAQILAVETILSTDRTFAAADAVPARPARQLVDTPNE